MSSAFKCPRIKLRRLDLLYCCGYERFPRGATVADLRPSHGILHAVVGIGPISL